MAAAKAVKRRVVPKLPEGVEGTIRHNRELLSLCNDDLDDAEKQEEALAFFNGSWNSQGLVHWCEGLCCTSDEHCQQSSG